MIAVLTFSIAKPRSSLSEGDIASCVLVIYDGNCYIETVFAA